MTQFTHIFPWLKFQSSMTQKNTWCFGSTGKVIFYLVVLCHDSYIPLLWPCLPIRFHDSNIRLVWPKSWIVLCYFLCILRSCLYLIFLLCYNHEKNSVFVFYNMFNTWKYSSIVLILSLFETNNSIKFYEAFLYSVVLCHASNVGILWHKST